MIGKKKRINWRPRARDRYRFRNEYTKQKKIENYLFSFNDTTILLLIVNHPHESRYKLIEPLTVISSNKRYE